MAKELAEAGRKGLAYRGSSGLVTVMETDNSNSTKATHDYKLLAAMRIKTTKKELDDVLIAGYEPIRLMSLGEFIILFDTIRTGAAR